MAITTLAGINAGLQYPLAFARNPSSMFAFPYVKNGMYNNGSPGGLPLAQVAPSPGVSGAALTSLNPGSFLFRNPVSGNSYLAGFRRRFTSNQSTTGGSMVIDRLWDNSGLSVTLTSAQTVNSVAWPARDANQSVNGEGVYIALEISASVGAGAPVYSLSYTNQAGTAGRTATGMATATASASLGHWMIFALQAGDTGVRSIQTYTSSFSMTSGSISLVAFRVISMFCGETAGGSTPSQIPQSMFFDALGCGFPRIWNDSVLQLINLPGSAQTPTGESGAILIAQG